MIYPVCKTKVCDIADVTAHMSQSFLHQLLNGTSVKQVSIIQVAQDRCCFSTSVLISSRMLRPILLLESCCYGNQINTS